MAGPLLETKLNVPRGRRALVARPRLSERLSRGAESALTLVSAPAGFGKTTLLTEWLAAALADGGSAAWLSLDQPDNDPARFWAYLIAALQKAVPGVGAGALSLLQSPQAPIEVVLATLLNDLGAISNDVVLVLDDYHVIDSRDVQDGMTFLLEHLPPADPPGDRQPRRPGVAAASVASARRARRDPGRRSALHARRSSGVPQPEDGTGPDGAGRRSAGGAHGRVDRRAPAGGALPAGPRRHRGLHRRIHGRRSLRRRLPGYVRRLLAAINKTGVSTPVKQGLAEPLSERELEVLRLVGTDLDGPDIARKLFVSLNTMRAHTKNVYAKLGVSNRRAAVRRAEELDLLSGTRDR